MLEALTKAIAGIPALSSWLTVSYVPTNGRFVFLGDRPFTVDAACGTKDRVTDYGLSYYLGFTRSIYNATLVDPSNTQLNLYSVESECPSDFSRDKYFLVCLNNYACVIHSANGSTQNVFAKIILKDQGKGIVFDDYGGYHIKEITFTAPETIGKLNVKLLDAYGDPIDLHKTNFSFSLEMLEVKNPGVLSGRPSRVGPVSFGAG